MKNTQPKLITKSVGYQFSGGTYKLPNRELCMLMMMKMACGHSQCLIICDAVVVSDGGQLLFVRTVHSRIISAWLQRVGDI
jgi:hypothetical protein